jgi:heavy metal sensor kinase
MSIRNRLSLWFGGILLVSLVVLAGVVHYEWEEQVKRLHVEKQEPEPAWQETGEIVFVYGGATALLLLLGSWWLLRTSLAPVITLTRAAERIHVDNLKERLPGTGTGDELDRLTGVFNAMMARLDDSVTRVRDFTLHASHELKTPLTVMRAQIETALREEHITPAQRELFANQLEEIQRLTKIVNSLAFLAKADSAQAAFQLETVRLDELVNDSFADAEMLARPQGITVELPACEETSIQADRHRLRQLLLNLTDNAIKFNRPDGRVSISLCRNNGLAELKISNTGPGVPSEKLARVFDRFYRGDPAHNSEVEGCGLGLSIAKWITKAHRGEIQMVSDPNQWTTVIVTMPVATPSSKS